MNKTVSASIALLALLSLVPFEQACAVEWEATWKPPVVPVAVAYDSERGLHLQGDAALKIPFIGTFGLEVERSKKTPPREERLRTVTRVVEKEKIIYPTLRIVEGEQVHLYQLSEDFSYAVTIENGELVIEGNSSTLFLPDPEDAPNARTYSLQVASFEDPDRAHDLAADLLLQGYDAFVKRVILDDIGVRTRVRVGYFDSKREARSALAEYQRRTPRFSDAWVARN